jgi:hypothetical protein
MTQEVTLYCTKCGSRITDGQCKNKCDFQNRGPLSPSQRIRCNQIPGIIGSKLTGVQSNGLAFGVKKVLVKSAVIQSFNLGAKSSGNVKFAGAARSFGRWAVFGGMGSIQQTSVNSYQTDIQIKLEDDLGQKAFLAFSLPFAITLSIDPGDSLNVYFVQGGLPKPTAPGDFRIDAWSPFLAESEDTGQLIPITGLPTLGPPPTGLLKTSIVGLLLTVLLISVQAGAVAVVFSVLFTSPFIVGAILRARDYKLSLSETARTAAALAV